jgi:hypothetical protein
MLKSSYSLTEAPNSPTKCVEIALFSGLIRQPNFLPILYISLQTSLQRHKIPTGKKFPSKWKHYMMNTDGSGAMGGQVHAHPRGTDKLMTYTNQYIY